MSWQRSAIKEVMIGPLVWSRFSIIYCDIFFFLLFFSSKNNFILELHFSSFYHNDFIITFLNPPIAMEIGESVDLQFRLFIFQNWQTMFLFELNSILYNTDSPPVVWYGITKSKKKIFSFFLHILLFFVCLKANFIFLNLLVPDFRVT